MRIEGTNGNNRLDGTREADVIFALDGDDRVFGYAGNDTIYGGDGDDVLHGMDGNDVLYGKLGRDELHGGEGRDIIHGGGGGDILYGGPGGDLFVYDALPPSWTVHDFIYDFNYNEGDRIDLSGIDANANLAGNQAFRFADGNRFSGRAGELITINQVSGGDDLQLRSVAADVDGDARTDFFIMLPGPGDLPASTFIL